MNTSPVAGRDGQLVATVYNIFSLVYDDLMRSRDATPLWERCLGTPPCPFLRAAGATPRIFRCTNGPTLGALPA